MATERLPISAPITVGIGAAPRIGVTTAVSRALADASRRRLAYAAAKRTLDVAVALVVLVVCAPLLLVVACAIWLDDRAPALYRQERVGLNGRPFTLIKFRSMRRGADSSPHLVFVKGLLRDGAAPCGIYKVANDRRITRVGAFLRRTSLDELPQLWNVLRGEMSIVGPRPDVPYAVSDYADWMHRRLCVRPGITGLWQVSGRSRVSLHDMYRLDAEYVDRASFRLDLRILLRTVPAVLCRDGAA